ncbi:MAG: prepilin-type N-terminal cleavage/methylation domain-containing protein [Gammaproteobacteria bacterium]|nr:prepilin-type N-terminal cleavage/methylation domain-containing protein [Gammaproteobacteria bacterium]NIM72284.1 prepilin-type N-terminal cleavage/methylation domain-containing protein [Gammaproteobacteria bacterium]NIN39794.1 prepilin-type N-terminal cleavage/methylation domain-containing protein [Gammaproteobacteria bacterium]NIO24043.1 prepilin-type N-terminal cleavage/methylation domain-containing protein [Gammaproteobacteria bacterium]NIP45486.1 prepilin-type N-terminal cleavage/methyl
MSIGRNRLNRERGLSLVELMVAITIGAILLGGAVTLFINNRDTYNTATQMARLQETARYALDMIVKDIRMAGYFGCADRLDTVRANVPLAAGDVEGELWRFNMDPAFLDVGYNGAIVPPIEGMDLDADTNRFLPSQYPVTVDLDAATDTTNGGATGEVLPETDAITIRYIAGSMETGGWNDDILDLQVISDVVSGSDSPIDVGLARGFARGQVAAISNCGTADIFWINAPVIAATSSTSPATVQAQQLRNAYNASASSLIAPYVAVRYYIGDNNRGNGEIRPSLYRAVIRPTGSPPGAPFVEAYEEIFEGVEQLQILYGVDGDGDGVLDSYVRAGEPPLADTDPAVNWAKIVSVRLAVLMRTVNEYGREEDKDTKTYTVNDQDDQIHNGALRAKFGPYNDRRRRRVFTTTAVVRNLS